MGYQDTHNQSEWNGGKAAAAQDESDANLSGGICRKPQKCGWSLPSSAKSAGGVLTNFSLLNRLSQNANLPLTGAGMINLGNTCFLNTVLQCLIHTVPFLHAILSNQHLQHSNCNKEEFCLLCTLQKLIVDSLTKSVFSPSDLANNLSYISPSFKKFHQEDAHEFFQCFLDKLESCYDDNIVNQVFSGRVCSELKCCNCGHSSNTYERSIDLSLDIKDADNLLTALQSYTKVERIGDPETKPTCEKCKEQVFVEKKLSLDQLPSVAVFHLKRFRSDGSLIQKIDKHVAFPLDLDLLPFTGCGEKNDVELKYVLYAVVVHVGSTALSGHYYCFIRLSPNEWCKFDDSKVVPVHENVVLSQEAYVLLYAKKSTPWFLSFIERQKRFVLSTLWDTSPKSVLDNADASWLSPNLEKKLGRDFNDVGTDFGSEHKGADENGTKHNGPMQNKIESSMSTYQLHGVSELVGVRASDLSEVSLPRGRKVSPILLEKVNQQQGVCVLANCQNDTRTAMRSPSPEIYKEDPPDAVFSIARDHLRLVNRMSCKRRLEKDMDNVEVRQARSFIINNMPSSRGKQLLAALRGSKNEGSVNTKKSKRLESQRIHSSSFKH